MITTDCNYNDDLDKFLEGMEPHLKRVLANYDIPDKDVEDILHQTFLSFLFHLGNIREPQDWILDTLRQHCENYRQSAR